MMYCLDSANTYCIFKCGTCLFANNNILFSSKLLITLIFLIVYFTIVYSTYTKLYKYNKYEYSQYIFLINGVSCSFFDTLAMSFPCMFA